MLPDSESRPNYTHYDEDSPDLPPHGSPESDDAGDMSDNGTVRRGLRWLVATVAVVALVPLAPVVSTTSAQAVTTLTYRGCPTSVPSDTLRDGSSSLGASALCRQAVAAAATPQAALAIQAAFHMLGAPYACGGVGRMDAFRFDCSSLVSRAYYLGAGLDTAGKDWAPSTRDMVPWDGVRLASWASRVAPSSLRPGDLVLYDTGGSTYRHVVMYIGNGYMLHTNSCGDVAHVSTFWGFPSGGGHVFLVARRVTAPAGYVPPAPTPIPTPTPTPTPTPAPATTPSFPGGTLALGSTGTAVAAVQRALTRTGHLHPERFGAIKSGTFGSQTRDAVAAYQHDHPSLPGTTGIVDRALYMALTGWRPTSVGHSSAEPGKPTISLAQFRAHNRASVKVVQAALNRMIGAGIRVDGLWGARTQGVFDSYRRGVLRSSPRLATVAPTRATLTALGQMAGFRVVS